MINNLTKDYRQSFYFSLNSAIITVFGLLVGITRVTNNYNIIIISVLSLAVSDSIADGFSIYISKKAENPNDKSNKPLNSLIITTIIKFITIISFLFPFLFSKNINYFNNLLWPIIWSLILIVFLDYNLTELRNEQKGKYFILQIIIMTVIVFLINIFNKK